MMKVLLLHQKMVIVLYYDLRIFWNWYPKALYRAGADENNSEVVEEVKEMYKFMLFLSY